MGSQPDEYAEAGRPTTLRKACVRYSFGWRDYTDHFGTPFKNQGDCVSYLATGGTNLADG